MTALNPTEDRFLSITMTISLAGHAVLLAFQLMNPSWGRSFHAMKPVRLIYEPESAHERSQWAQQELHQARLKDLPEPTTTPSEGGMRGTGYRPSAVGSDAASLMAQVKVGRSRADWSALAAPGGALQAAVDLANLAEASRGNPVLYSYFSAIREQIQQRANERAWLPEGVAVSGTVYIGFVITRTGAVQSAAVMEDRSVDSPVLQKVALRIIQASAPFPPFPPSFEDSSKAIMVPIEFAPGSS